MALGAWWSGRRFRTGRPLRVCGVMELLLGVMGLLAPRVLDALPGMLAFLVHSGVPLDAARFGVGVLVLLPPTFLMGATFPLWVRGLLAADCVRGLVARRSAQVCTVQVIGAALGAFVAGFLLIPALGFSFASYLAGVTDIVLGTALIVALSRREDPSTAESTTADARHGSPVGLAFVLAGFASLGLQTLWTRAMVFFLDGLHFAFAAVLTTHLLGLGLGSAMTVMLAKRVKNPRSWLAVAQILAACGALLTLFLAPLFGEPAALALADPDGYRLRLFGLCAAFLLLPAALLGTTLPLATWIATHGERSVSRGLGRAYGATTCGNAAGALLVPLVLVPGLGLRTAWAAMAVFQGVAAVLLARSPRARRFAAGFLVLALGATFLVYRVKEPLILSSHVFKGTRGTEHRLVESHDGEACSVAVVANDRHGNRILYTDAFAAAATGREYPYMRLLGHLPVLLCAHPQRVLVVCFGTGTTAGAVAAHPDVQTLRLVDVEVEVFRAAPHFSEVNENVLDGREGLAIEQVVRDGRLDLILSREKFDVITLEPLLPYTQGAVHFYSREFYELARSRLSEGGTFCQWIPVHALPVKDYRMLVKTFFKVFPEGDLYFFEQSSLLLARKGGEAPLAEDYARRAAVPAVARSLEQSLIGGPWDLLAGRVASANPVRALLAADPAMRDDHPRTMFLEVRPTSLVPQRETLGLLRELAALESGSPTAERRVTGLVAEGATRIALLAETRRGLLRARHVDASWMTGSLRQEDGAEARGDPVLVALEDALLSAPGHLEGLRLKRRREVLLSRVLAVNDLRQGQPHLACARLSALGRVPDRDTRLQVLEGEAFLTLGFAARALEALDASLAAFPREVRGLVARARARSLLGDGAGSQADSGRARELDPEKARIAANNLNVWSQAAARSGLGGRALEVAVGRFEDALRTSPLVKPGRVMATREKLGPVLRNVQVLTFLGADYVGQLRSATTSEESLRLAVRAAASLGIRSAEEALSKIADSQGPLAEEALFALSAIVPASLDRLTRIWREKDPIPRRLLAWFAAERGRKEHAASYLPGLTDADEDVRLATVRALRTLTGQSVDYDYQATPVERRNKAAEWGAVLRTLLR